MGSDHDRSAHRWAYPGSGWRRSRGLLFLRPHSRTGSQRYLVGNLLRRSGSKHRRTSRIVNSAWPGWMSVAQIELQNTRVGRANGDTTEILPTGPYPHSVCEKESLDEAIAESGAGVPVEPPPTPLPSRERAAPWLEG